MSPLLIKNKNKMISRRSFSKLVFFNFVSLFFPKFSFARNKIVNKKIIPKSGEKITPIGMGSWLTFDVMPTKTNIKNCVEILKIFLKRRVKLLTLPLCMDKQKR
jgi:hypothetical protein